MVGNILVENGGIKSKWNFNFVWRKSDQWKWNVHWKNVEKVESENMQTKNNIVEENEEQRMKKNLEKA